MSSKRKSILQGAVILTAAGIITRVLGFVYRIYMSKTIGAEGMGLFQLIMPLYSLAWSIACSGITTTVTKLIAAENAKKEHGNIKRLVSAALAMTVSAGIVLAIVMFFGAEFIGAGIFNEPRTVIPIKLLAVAIPFMAAGSGIRGYFSGLQEMHVPAISQVLEQCVRMAVIYLMAQSFIERGLEFACAAAVIGIVAGEALSFLYVLNRYRSRTLKRSFNEKKPIITLRAAIGTILPMALPLTLNRITGSLLGTLENVLIPRSLQAFGMSSSEAIASYGRITGMTMPLIFFPSVFLLSLSTSIVPAVSEAAAVNRVGRLSGILSKALLFSVIVGIGAAAVFAVLPEELGLVIYNQHIGETLFALAFLCPFIYLNTTLGGILNGLGEQKIIFRNNLISSAINIVYVIFLVPRFGIKAFAAGLMTASVTSTLLSFARIRKSVELGVKPVDFLFKPLLAGTAAALVCKTSVARRAPEALGQPWGLVVSAIAIIFLYILFIILLGVISLKDVKKLFKSVLP